MAAGGDADKIEAPVVATGSAGHFEIAEAVGIAQGEFEGVVARYDGPGGLASAVGEGIDLGVGQALPGAVGLAHDGPNPFPMGTASAQAGVEIGQHQFDGARRAFDHPEVEPQCFGAVVGVGGEVDEVAVGGGLDVDGAGVGAGEVGLHGEGHSGVG